jgi:hypothetical protein
MVAACRFAAAARRSLRRTFRRRVSASDVETRCKSNRRASIPIARVEGGREGSLSEGSLAGRRRGPKWSGSSRASLQRPSRSPRSCPACSPVSYVVLDRIWDAVHADTLPAETRQIEHLARLKSLTPQDSADGQGFTQTFADAAPILADCSIGDSIAVNGVCLTVTDFGLDVDGGWFKVGLAPETLQRTSLGESASGAHKQALCLYPRLTTVSPCVIL